MINLFKRKCDDNCQDQLDAAIATFSESAKKAKKAAEKTVTLIRGNGHALEKVKESLGPPKTI